MVAYGKKSDWKKIPDGYVAAATAAAEDDDDDDEEEEEKEEEEEEEEGEGILPIFFYLFICLFFGQDSFRELPPTVAQFPVA